MNIMAQQRQPALDQQREVILVMINTIVAFVEELLSSDEEDEDNVIEKIENFAEVTVPNFNDGQFKEHFRMLPTTFENLLTQFHDAVNDLHEVHSGQPEISIEKQVLIGIWCLANTECFRSVADRFGISKSCCWRVLYRFCNRLLIVNRHFGIIAFPEGERALQIINDFEGINGFPGVVGAIDGCHIRIAKPRENPNSYINRKGYPSVLLQGICDSNKLFLDVYAGEPGSIHDSRLYTKSDISVRIRDNEIQLPNHGHLIGDLAYRLTTNLIVGFKNNGNLTARQRYFNQKLSQIRVVIENAFGLLKCRFRRLKMLDTVRLDLISLLIVSACVLHNVCIMNADFFNGPLDNGDDDEEINNEVEGAAAIAKRQNIVNYLYNNRNE